ncbi:MAG: hypothetical protein Q8R18_05475 [bacterium]|nr:hypothetical protein [bacterium]
MRRKEVSLALILISCAHNTKIVETIETIKESTYTFAQMEVYLDLQGRCEDLLTMFKSGEFRVSEEPYEERRSLFIEASQLDLWDYIPKRFDYCLEAIQKY